MQLGITTLEHELGVARTQPWRTTFEHKLRVTRTQLKRTIRTQFGIVIPLRKRVTRMKTSSNKNFCYELGATRTWIWNNKNMTEKSSKNVNLE